MSANRQMKVKDAVSNYDPVSGNAFSAEPDRDEVEFIEETQGLDTEVTTNYDDGQNDYQSNSRNIEEGDEPVDTGSWNAVDGALSRSAREASDKRETMEERAFYK